MDHDLPKAEKIRFRRGEITDLGAMPSAAGRDLSLRRRSRGSRAAKAIVSALALAATAAGLVVAVAFAIGMSGVGAERLRLEAEQAIEGVVGVDVDATLGSTRISLDGSSLVALEARDVSLKKAGDGTPIVEAGTIRFGIRFLPLLTGNVRLGSAMISDARISTAMLSPAGRTDWTKILRNEDGLLDPDKAAEVVFERMHLALDAVENGSTHRIDLENVEFILPEEGRLRVIGIDSAALARIEPDGLAFDAVARIDGRRMSFSGTAARDRVSGRISDLKIGVVAEPPDIVAAGETPASASRFGGFDLALSGQEGIGSAPARLTARLALRQSVLDLGARGAFSGKVALDATLVAGSDKLEIDRLAIDTGRNSYEFNGAVGPRPRSGNAGERPAYRYELVSTRAVLAPGDSPEPALDLLAHISGSLDAEATMLVADQIALKSGTGEVLGSGAVDFVDGKAPGIAVAFTVHDMPVAHVKQLWPWFAAAKARGWVLDHFFGGRVADGRVQFRVMPGRLGNGVPLSAQEVSGRFDVEGARFDTAGLIPPVRDANGRVEFRGGDVDVSLSSGTVYLPSGRSVAATNGRLLIEKANRPPVIGALDIDVAGDAAAITELASYEPINAMRFIGAVPEDFSGQVSGNVKADIPLQKGVDKRTLDWLVALDYTGLSVEKPFDGQKLSDAEGSITIDPSKAVMAAKGMLNGIPAEIALVEPLRPEGAERQRKVQLVLDDKARDALAPGLSAMVSGAVKIDLDAQDGKKRIKADLTDAKLDIPWAGWSKGAGVAATASFVLETSEGNTRLSDFSLKGKSFAIDGAATLSNGSLASARFTQVTLNRGDDVAVTVERSGKSYAVGISGSAFDARSLIKRMTSDAGLGAKTTGSGAISVDVDVKTLAGFHGESLSNVKLGYKGQGSKVNGLEVEAVSSSGGAVTVRNSSEGGSRKLQMQSADAGAILRFLNIYEHMEGGAINLSLSGSGDGPMKGRVDATNFWVVNEPKLASIVSTAPAGGERSLNQAVRSDIDTSRVQFERGSTRIDKGSGYLKLANGVLRGPLIGTTFQGTLYDKNGRMDMTGTFMPAYGLNRIFGELPIIGVILGNGRDRGLIGVTYKLEGDAKAPRLQINPLSIIAPGIFRSIFEYQ
ncbi:MAG: hypothetical protein H0T56_01125 [Pseudaminobacter sp.]|nr:hypothetical protein [Pseudaminobacter sp.]